MRELNETAHKLLNAAEVFTQTKGFNAFSYKDLQSEVGVKTSTIHYYFPSKQDLALSMTERFIDNFHKQLDAIADQHEDGIKRLEVFGQIFVSVVRDGQFCLCGMLASDMTALPDSVNQHLIEFFQTAEKWVASTIEVGKQQSTIPLSVNSACASAHFIAAVEGGMLIARVQKRPEYLEMVINEAIRQLQN